MELNKNNDEFYFLHLLLKSLSENYSKDNIKRSLREIMNLGRDSEYEIQYRNFLELFERDSKDMFRIEDREGILERIIFSLLSDEIEVADEQKEKLIEVIRKNPKTREIYKNISAKYFTEVPLELVLIKDGKEIKSSPILANLKEIAYENIGPGNYEIRYSTGLLLWKGNISSNDISWSIAFPNKPYPMAADTGISGFQKNEYRVEVIIPDDMVLEIVPDLSPVE